MGNGLEVNDGVMVGVDLGECLNECGSVGFCKIMRCVIGKCFKVMGIGIVGGGGVIIGSL